MKKLLTMPAGVLAITLATGVAPTVMPHPAAAQNPTLSNLIPESDEVTIQAKITAINPETREVTLTGASGQHVTVIAGPAVQLDRLQVGQTVNAKYYRSVAFQIMPPASTSGNTSADQAPVSNNSVEQLIARGAQAPGGIGVRVTKVQATVVGIDLPANSIDVVNPSGGGIYTIQVTNPERIAKLSSLKVGDTITAVISQTLAVS